MAFNINNLQHLLAFCSEHCSLIRSFMTIMIAFNVTVVASDSKSDSF